MNETEVIVLGSRETASGRYRVLYRNQDGTTGVEWSDKSVPSGAKGYFVKEKFGDNTYTNFYV